MRNHIVSPEIRLEAEQKLRVVMEIRGLRGLALKNRHCINVGDNETMKHRLSVADVIEALSLAKSLQLCEGSGGRYANLCQLPY